MADNVYGQKAIGFAASSLSWCRDEFDWELIATWDCGFSGPGVERLEYSTAATNRR